MKTSLKMLGVSLAALASLSLLAGDNAAPPAATEAPAPATATKQSPPADTVQPAPAKAATPATTRTNAIPKSVSYETAQVVKLAQVGIDPAVIKAYVENSQIAAAPSVDEILYLRNQGVSSDTIAALIRRGNLLQTQTTRVAQTAQVAQTPAPQVVPAPAPVYVSAPPAQTPVYVYSQPEPSYTYVEYPRYDYGWSYGWPVAYGWSSGIYCSSYPYHRFGYNRSYPGYRNYASIGHGGFDHRGRDFGQVGNQPPTHFNYGNRGSWGGGTPRPGGWSGGTPRPGGWSGGTPGGGLSGHRGR